MLVLSRKVHQTIVIGKDVRITLIASAGQTVRLGIEAPPAVAIMREELCEETAADHFLRPPRGPL